MGFPLLRVDRHTLSWNLERTQRLSIALRIHDEVLHHTDGETSSSM
jgi:hypothetical protein